MDKFYNGRISTRYPIVDPQTGETIDYIDGEPLIGMARDIVPLYSHYPGSELVRVIMVSYSLTADELAILIGDNTGVDARVLQ